MTSFVLIITLSLAALPEMTGVVADVWNTYLAGDFKHVNLRVSALADSPEVNNHDKAILMLTLGCSEAMQGNKSAAAEAFARSLDLNPDLGVTSTDLPPPVWEIYHTVVLKLQREKVNLLPVREANQGPNENTSGDTEIGEDIPVTIVNQPANSSRNSTALKSVIFPGWGHLSDGRRLGSFIIAAEIALITGFIVTSSQASQARDDYVNAREPSIIEDRYAEYNNLFRISRALGIASAATYLLAQYDYFGHEKNGNITLSYHSAYLLSISLAL